MCFGSLHAHSELGRCADMTAMPGAVDSRHVLVISHEVVGDRMAGPGIRYYYLARSLAKEFSVSLAVPAGSTLLPQDTIRVVAYTEDHVEILDALARISRVVVVPAVWLSKIPSLKSMGVPLAVDGYDPVIVEMLSMQAGGIDAMQQRLKEAYLAGDFFMCASERQRDWWLGLLEANGRLNARNFAADSSFRSLIDIVPFGMPDDPPAHSAQFLKGVWPGIASSDRVILWGGGLWTWLDPLTAIRAVAILWERRQDIRLVFPGTAHPNPSMASAPTLTVPARELARELGLLDTAVFFGDWVPYADWPSFLLESDVGLVLHSDTVETRLSFRSRLFDYIWAGLPVVTSGGDSTSDIIKSYGLGEVVGYGDVEGVAASILRMLDDRHKPLPSAFEAARRQLSWSKASNSLLQFCRNAKPAPDKVASSSSAEDSGRVQRAGGDPPSAPSSRELWDKLQAMQVERDHWQSLVEQYERGRFIRAMRRLHEMVNSRRAR